MHRPLREIVRPETPRRFFADDAASRFPAPTTIPIFTPSKESRECVTRMRKSTLADGERSRYDETADRTKHTLGITTRETRSHSRILSVDVTATAFRYYRAFRHYRQTHSRTTLLTNERHRTIAISDMRARKKILPLRASKTNYGGA